MLRNMAKVNVKTSVRIRARIYMNNCELETIHMTYAINIAYQHCGSGKANTNFSCSLEGVLCFSMFQFFKHSAI
jgi:hypothetical protein